MQTPNKQGDDGWKSTLYEGQPLETYRRKYFQESGLDGDDVAQVQTKQHLSPCSLPSSLPCFLPLGVLPLRHLHFPDCCMLGQTGKPELECWQRADLGQPTMYVSFKTSQY